MVNCLAAGGLREVYVQLLHALSPTAAVDKNMVCNLEHLLFDVSGDNGRGGMVLLVLDELDSAMGGTGSVPEEDLRKLFGWIHRERSRVVLLGIGNMLDLFNRSLASFASSLEMLSFPPYSAADMLAILNARLASPLPILQAPRADADENSINGDAGPGPSAPGDVLIKFDAAALDLCSRRISAESGDVRKALQACRLAACTAAASSGTAVGDGGRAVFAVGVGIMARKLSELLAGQGAQRFGGIAALPLHQQLLLCALARHAAAALPPLALAALGAAYARLCRKHGLTPVAAPEVVAVLDGLVDGGLVARGKGGAAVLAVPLPHLTAALQAAAPLIASILAAP
jgi:Cdc6-like AAA superfamily ATPase